MHRRNILSLLVVTFFVSNFAWAAGYMRLGTMYMSADTGNGTTSRTLLDLGMGYVGQKGWAVGFLYGTEKSDYGGYSFDRSGAGLSLGWITRAESGFYIHFTYYPTVNSNGGLKGKGSQIDLGYKFMINKVAFGPQLSKKSFTFDEMDGRAVTPEMIDDRIDPYFVISTDF